MPHHRSRFGLPPRSHSGRHHVPCIQWIPAFAGMTAIWLRPRFVPADRGRDCRRLRANAVQSSLREFVGNIDESALYTPAPMTAPVIGARM